MPKEKKLSEEQLFQMNEILVSLMRQSPDKMLHAVADLHLAISVPLRDVMRKYKEDDRNNIPVPSPADFMMAFALYFTGQYQLLSNSFAKEGHGIESRMLVLAEIAVNDPMRMLASYMKTAGIQEGLLTTALLKDSGLPSEDVKEILTTLMRRKQ